MISGVARTLIGSPPSHTERTYGLARVVALDLRRDDALRFRGSGRARCNGAAALEISNVSNGAVETRAPPPPHKHLAPVCSGAAAAVAPRARDCARQRAAPNGQEWARLSVGAEGSISPHASGVHVWLGAKHRNEPRRAASSRAEPNQSHKQSSRNLPEPHVACIRRSSRLRRRLLINEPTLFHSAKRARQHWPRLASAASAALAAAAAADSGALMIAGADTDAICCARQR